MTARIGVVLFPGSNCEYDVVAALGGLGAEATLVWHGDRSLGDVDAVVLPGGFAHGDYLRPGAIARFSPIMAEVSSFAAAGGPVVGICNGFQVLTEAHLLPGALQKNRGLTFLCTTVDLEVTSGRERPDPGGRPLGPGCASRSTISKATTPATRPPSPSCAGTSASCSATSTIPTVRSTTSPGSATRAATWSASCPTLSGPATRCWVRPTASCSCGVC